jgi:hypothetical protein
VNIAKPPNLLQLAKLREIESRSQPPRRQAGIARQTYFNALETVEKGTFNCVPIALTTATIASAMPAAIRLYSIAVAAV